MFRKILQRRQERRELEAKLEALTDPTLIDRMYADRPKSQIELLNKALAEFGKAMSDALRPVVEVVNNLTKEISKK